MAVFVVREDAFTERLELGLIDLMSGLGPTLTIQRMVTITVPEGKSAENVRKVLEREGAQLQWVAPGSAIAIGGAAGKPKKREAAPIHCEICGEEFVPRQSRAFTCGKTECVAERKKRYMRQYYREHGTELNRGKKERRGARVAAPAPAKATAAPAKREEKPARIFVPRKKEAAQSQPVAKPAPSKGTKDKPSEYTTMISGEKVCVLCGHRYRNCNCRCTWCGTKKWAIARGRWVHHVCAGKKANPGTGGEARQAV